MKTNIIGKRFALALLISAVTLTAESHDFIVDDLYYAVDEGDASSVYVTNGGWEWLPSGKGYHYVTVPAQVTHRGVTYRVRAIGESAFGGNRTMRMVTLPETLEEIGDRAFADCYELADVTIPPAVKRIGLSAFFNCRKLTGIEIPTSVVRIGPKAFSMCTKLADLRIADSAEPLTFDCSYAAGTFEKCPLRTVHVGRDVEYEAQGCYPFQRTAAKECAVTVGDSVTRIIDGEFKEFLGMTSIALPPTLKSIGASAFHKCINLTELVIPEPVESIGAAAFMSCDQLATIEFPATLREVGLNALRDCFRLTTVTSHATVPPTLSVSFALSGVKVKQCVLRVPEASAGIYSGSFGWRDLKNVEVF